MNTAFPANATLLYQVIMQIAAFDILPMDDIYRPIFDFTPTEPINLNFYLAGYESLNFLECLGSAFFVGLYLTVLILLTVLVKIYTSFCKVGTKAQKCVNFMANYAMWNQPITFLMEIYLVICFATISNISALHYSNLSNLFNTFWTFVYFFLVVTFPVFVFGFLLVKFPKLDDEEY